MKQHELFTMPHKESVTGTIIAMDKMRVNGERLGISPRQIEILQLLAFGKLQKQVADDLKISAHTVNNHLRFAYAKMGVKNIAHAVAILTS